MGLQVLDDQDVLQPAAPAPATYPGAQKPLLAFRHRGGSWHDLGIVGDRHTVDQPIAKCRAWDNLNDHSQEKEQLRKATHYRPLRSSKGRRLEATSALRAGGRGAAILLQ